MRLPTSPLSRAAVVVAVSVALHALVVMAFMASSLARLWPSAPAIEIEVVSTPPTALPLEAPAPPAAPPSVATAGVKKPKAGPGPKHTPDAGPDAAEPSDAGVASDALPDGAGADAGKPGGLRADGPEGARLVVRLRLDRLREAPQSTSFTALADELLKLLPDRHRLIEGSGLNIFADFDTMVVATPNPLDDAVTFLAVHHHVPDAALTLALGRAATANARPIEWTTLRGRPVGLRPPGASPSRDDRVFVLPEPGWAVIAPAAYMQLLVPELVKAPAGTPDVVAPEDFGTLAGRLRGEEAAMGEGVVLMATASQLLSARPGQKFSLPGSPPLEIPSAVTLQVRLDPEPVLELTLGFADREAAAGWTAALPPLCRQFANHPMVVFAGMTAALTRISVVQTAQDLPGTGADVLIKAPLSSDEAARILGMSTNLLRSRLRR
ncbi:MAG: hypothetical protein SF187_00695 [Deltaproteobacteria bacterium]|nr:hypothetical protein [Deltaproteobacteria bacterium]